MLGDGIRRNIATVTKEERDRLVAAIKQLHDNFQYSDTDPATGNPISFFAKQQWVHYAGHGSGGHPGPMGLPWHRELCNRFEALIRVVDPQLSLHYWDWTQNPRNLIDSDGNPFSLFSTDFLGNDAGDVGNPFANFETTPDGSIVNGVAQHFPLADKPGHSVIWRNVAAGAPVVSVDPNLADVIAEQAVAPDSLLLTWPETHGLSQSDQYGIGPDALFTMLFHGHNYLHFKYVGGTFSAEHISNRDPIFYLIHSNLDRLWAMWQRATGQQWRLDPSKTYGAQTSNVNQSLLPWNGQGAPLLGNVPLRPWDPNVAPSGGDLLDPGHTIVAKTPLDPTIVIPPSYDTAVHSSYIITNRDTFSTDEVSTLGIPALFKKAFYVVYDGFTAKELGATTLNPRPVDPPTKPTFTFAGAGNMTQANASASYEDGGNDIDLPQRITIAYDLQFNNTNDFPTTLGGEVTVNMQASLSYNVDTGTGGATVQQTASANSLLALVKQANPYMIDVDPVAQNPSWLSVDTRVFQVKGPDQNGVNAGTKVGVTQGNDPFAFIGSVLSSLRGNPSQFNDPLQFSTDENASVLELSRSVGMGMANQRVYNYAVARVRYRAPVNANVSNVQAFFRVFSTLVSALDYDTLTPTSSIQTGNYRRTASTAASIAMPLLGIQLNQSGTAEIASIPFFAEARHADMTTQTDATNIQPINGTGGENVWFFGCWLDINQTDLLFPSNPLTQGGPNGPFNGTLQSIQTLIMGHHQCLVAEVFFWPTGIATDPIPLRASPASSDRLAQRNLSIVPSGNPTWPETHTVQHTFVVKPSVMSLDQSDNIAVAAKPARRGRHAAAAEAGTVGIRYFGPDELIVRWNNVPRDSTATFYFPEAEVDEILALSALRQHPEVLSKIDAHTLGCRLADITFIPLPTGRHGTLAGLMTLTLSPGVRVGQVYHVSVEQYSGFTRKTLGAFQMTIPVKEDSEILPGEIRKLSVLRYVQQSIPASSRWYNIFVRYLDQIAARVRGFGGDPNTVKPSPDGGEGGVQVCPPPPPREVCPPDLFCLNIPWKECDIEGEIELKLRFKRKCKE